jgi:hypothetical protein
MKAISSKATKRARRGKKMMKAQEWEHLQGLVASQRITDKDINNVIKISPITLGNFLKNKPEDDEMSAQTGGKIREALAKIIEQRRARDVSPERFEINMKLKSVWDRLAVSPDMIALSICQNAERELDFHLKFRLSTQ